MTKENIKVVENKNFIMDSTDTKLVDSIIFILKNLESQINDVVELKRDYGDEVEFNPDILQPIIDTNKIDKKSRRHLGATLKQIRKHLIDLKFPIDEKGKLLNEKTPKFC